jgi:alpha-tubulin suppressor-like RCC1 family protein
VRRASCVAAVLFLLTCGSSAGTTIVPSITAGFTHTCSVTTEARCWGDNRDGQLGDGTTTERLTPVPVVGLESGAVVSGSWAFHTCAIVGGGALKCWGGNDVGQLGDGTKVDRLTPVPVTGLSSGVEAVSLGSGHTCAITAGGRLQCWGFNTFGVLGNGGDSPSLVPVNVSGLADGVEAVSAGLFHTCAIKSGGLLCWGNNFDSQVGNESCQPSCSTPVQVSGLRSGVAEVSAGAFHTCALLTDGRVKCWGSNEGGSLGDGTEIDRKTPVFVRGLSGVQAVSVGGLHTCALLESGGVKCWGSNSYGELGDGTKKDRKTPVAVRGLSSGVQQIAAGGGHTCALLSGGGIRCWGSNRYGQLGNGRHTNNLDIFIKGRGTVTAPGYRCTGNTCFIEYAPSAKLTFKAHAAKGWKFTKWAGACKGSKPRCTLKLTADKTVKATFKRR